MGLRARVTRRAFWQRRIVYHYQDTYLATELDALGTWFVFDTRDPHTRVSGPFFKLQQAKVAAERLVEADPGCYRLPKGDACATPARTARAAGSRSAAPAGATARAKQR
jgi:hypothetical protein